MPPRKKPRTTSRNKSSTSSVLGRNEAPTDPPPTTNQEGIPAPPEEHTSAHTPEVPAEASTSGQGTASGSKSDNWENLERLLNTLKRAASTSGLEPVRNVIKGLVELIGLYEDMAQGRKEFHDLRVQLECIFDELSHYISSSPFITSSMDSICWSIQKEIEIVKAQQARPKKRKHGDEENSVRMVLDCYRRIQDHLQRLTRNANTSTWMIVDQLATENRLQKLVSSLWECYNSIKANELKRGSCTPDTRMSVLAKMNHWATDENMANVFWMSGMAGTGKTTIAYTLCEQLDAKASRMLCASFFCSRSLPECRDVGRIIPSIAYQLARCSQPFRYALSRATEQDPDAHTRLPQLQFESLIVQPLLDARVKEAFPTNMVVVIDALDECDDVKSTKQILDILLTKSNNLPIKFVVSSRPEPAIRDQMEKNGTWVDARVVLHELDSGEVKTDIKTYLTNELAPVKALESDIEKLAERAGVLFIYAATVVRYVGYDDFARGSARLKAVLAVSEQPTKAQTKEIDQLYGAILEAAVGDMNLEPTERDDIKLILHTVICARAPLTIAALNQLLQLNDDDRVQAAIRPLWSVLHVMGPDMTITTLHASFPDYLLDSKRSGAWHCEGATHHQLLAQRCFECIRDTEPQFNICRIESSYLLDKEVANLDERVEKFIPSELRYSCQYWSSHLIFSESATASHLMPPLSQFITVHLLLWMEVRNLTNTFPSTLGDLTTAKRWATRHGGTREVIDLLSDAWRFASTFVSSPVSQSTPHLYVSMLPLLPSSSPIRRHYSGRFGGMIEMEGTALERRKDELLAQWKFELYIECMACSPDGTRVAIGDDTRDPRTDHIILLDAFSGTLLLDLSQGHKTEVRSIAFSPNSTHLASGRSDGRISVWDITTGKVLFGPFSAHSDHILSILYSHDGYSIISASEDKTIRIWDAVSGTPALNPFIGHTDPVTCIAITSNDTHLISGSEDGTIRVWGTQSGKMVLAPIIVHDDYVTAIVLSPDDSYIVSGSSNGNIRVWDCQTGQIVLGPLRDQGQRIRSLSMPPNGATIASTSDIDGVRVWSATTGKILTQLDTFSSHVGYDSWATYSPDGTRIILARRDGTIRLLDTQTGAMASDPLLGHSNSITSIDVSPDSRRVVSGSWDHTLCVWDVVQGTLLVGPLQGLTWIVNMVRISPDGSRIVSCGSRLTICQWDAQSGAVHGTPIEVASAGFYGVVSATYSRDGARIVTLTPEGELSVWNSSDGQCILGSVAASKPTNGIYADFSPDGTTVVAGYEDGSIAAWDVQNGQMVQSHKGQCGSDVTSLAFSPDGLCYAQSHSGRKISIATTNTGDQLPGVFSGHTDYIRSVRFSSDGTQLVSGSDDKTVHVWDVKTGQSLFGPLSGHTQAVRSVAFTPDGKYVVSSSEDLVIRVWNIAPEAPSVQEQKTEHADWVVNEYGWVVSGSSRRLFWVPTDLRASLMSPRNTTLISRDGNWRLSFDGAMIGEEWVGCFRSY